MSRTSGTWLIWSLAVLYIQLTKAKVIIPCPSVERDFYPGVKPQNSPSPYVLNVTDQDGRPLQHLFYNFNEALHTISLSGKQIGNETEKFIGFIITAYNEFEDEESGHFVTPLPEGVTKEECHYNDRSYINEVVKNSSYIEWNSLQIKWKSPKKYPAGKIIIRASVVKEYGVYWDGINVTLNYQCPVPGCYLPEGCPNGLARTKFGCITCECAGASAITVRVTSFLLIVFTLLYNLM